MDELSMADTLADEDLPGRALSLRHKYHGHTDEELLWELSRQTWARIADYIALALNLVILGRICFWLRGESSKVSHTAHQNRRVNETKERRLMRMSTDGRALAPLPTMM